ncbi:MAG: choice-of-anchor D domain-containing protein, partial [Verrucomicrobiota bacterium]|nr:choice-of-anchor D domain-containing protein [Verrucomicrobiota bacterium]
LTIASGYTLQGSFQLGVDFLRFTNNGTINANTSAGLIIDPTNALGDAVNNGLIKASNGATLTLYFGVYSNGSGTIQALAGSFVNIRDGARIIGGTLSTADLTGAGGVIQSINNASIENLTNNGFLNAVDNTTLQFVGTIVDNGVTRLNSAGNTTDLRLNGDVTLNGTGTLTGSNTLSNRVLGLTTGNETLTNGPSHTINGTMQLGQNFMNLVNQGLIESNQSNLIIDPTSTALNDITGTFRASSNAQLTLAGGSYTNNGTYEALTGSVLQMNSDAVLTNYNSGTMTLTGGTYRSVSTGGQSTLNLNIGQVVNNAAGIVLDGVNTIIHTSDNTTDALRDFNNNTATGSFTVTNGRNFNRTFAFNNAGLVMVGPSSLFTAVQFDLSGTLTGAGTLTDSGPLNWTAGTMSGTGITNANGPLNITTSANKTLDARTLNAAATTTWSAAGTIIAGNGAIFNNLAGATFNALTAQAIAYSGTGTAATFNNAGTFNKTGTGTTTTIDAIFNNSSVVNITSGTLSLQRGGTDTGSFADASGATLTFGGGTHGMNAGASVAGAGAVNFSLGVVNFASGSTYNISGLTTINSGAANFNNAATGAATAFTSGILGGTGSYTSGGLFTWSGGTMNGGGITNANAGLTLNGTTKTLVSRTLNNNGAATWSAGNFSAGQGAVFNNPLGSTFDDSFDGSWLFDQGGTLTQFNNGGSFTKSAGAGTTLLQLAFNNSGSVNANSGALSFSQGIQGTSGTVTIAPGATLNVSAGAFASSAATLNQNGNLSLGSNNFNVAVDYTNANFGTGNSFNPRANVTGTGGINATGNVNQSITGNVTGGTTTAPTIAFGNFHVGDGSVTKNYVINNTGSSGPSLRGAIQTSVNGGNITDARLSGTGVTATNWGALIAGASTGNFAVTFNPSSAGALSGQLVHVVNNFDNVQEQNIALTGGVYRLASASTHSPEPVTFGVVHIGDSPSQSLSVTNTAPNDAFSEKLDGSIGSTTGGVTASGSFSLLAPGSTSTSLAVGISTASAGTKDGTATIALVSNGTGTSGLANTNLTSQTVNVTGQVNYFADPVIVFKSGQATLTMQSPTMFTLVFDPVAQNSGTYLATFGLENFLHDATFQDLLGGTFDLTSLGNFAVTNTNPFSGVASGSSHDSDATFNSAMAPGTYNGQLRVSPTSTNASSSTNLNAITLNLKATIVPEPSTWALVFAGAGLLAALQRIRRRR